MKRLLIFVTSVAVLAGCAETEQETAPPPPGIVIDYSPAESEIYIGSPSIAILPDGSYVASHDFFGSGSARDRTAIFRSEDKGESWNRLTEFRGQWWSNLFVHRGHLFILGTSKHSGQVVIRKSTDRGENWTTPDDETSGLLIADGLYHCAPVPMLVHNGRIWRASEDKTGNEGWPEEFHAFVMSAPVDADLLRADSWTSSNRVRFDSTWVDADDPGWLEGNVVLDPDGRLVNVLRVNDNRGDRGAIAFVSEDGTELTFDPETGFIDIPGGRAKFTIRWDPESELYWTLSNKQRNPDAYRNILVLCTSPDLRNWTVRETILYHPDTENHAFQYIDWLFEGDDLIFVSRTAWDGAYRAHDANYMTFHRIEDFRAFSRD